MNPSTACPDQAGAGCDGATGRKRGWDHLIGQRTFSPLRKAFASIEIDLLRIAAILKHPSFREEKEWRIVSPVIANTAEAPILFREGHAMLVPYIEFFP